MGQLVNFFPMNITTLHHTILGSSQIKDSIPLDTSTCGDWFHSILTSLVPFWSLESFMKPAHQAELKRSERDFRCQSGAKLSAATVKMSYATSMGCVAITSMSISTHIWCYGRPVGMPARLWMLRSQTSSVSSAFFGPVRWGFSALPVTKDSLTFHILSQKQRVFWVGSPRRIKPMELLFHDKYSNLQANMTHGIKHKFTKPRGCTFVRIMCQKTVPNSEAIFCGVT